MVAGYNQSRSIIEALDDIMHINSNKAQAYGFVINVTHYNSLIADIDMNIHGCISSTIKIFKCIMKMRYMLFSQQKFE